MAQPLLARLREKLPGSRIEALAPPWVAPVLRRMAEVNEVIEAGLQHGAFQPGERWRLGRRLRQRAFDRAIVLPNTWKSALVPLFAGIPVRSGYIGESRFGLLNMIHGDAEGKSSMALRYARLAEEPGTETAMPLPATSLKIDSASVRQTAARFGISGRYTVFCPGAEYGPAKRWPQFRELALKLNTQVVLLGSASDSEYCGSVPGKDLSGKTTLDEAIELIAGAAAVVSNDSGLMHIAAAVGTPQVALFGSSSPEHTPPLSGVARVVWLRVECSPCFERVCPLGHFKCMNGISVDRVVQEMNALS